MTNIYKLIQHHKSHTTLSTIQNIQVPLYTLRVVPMFLLPRTIDPLTGIDPQVSRKKPNLCLNVSAHVTYHPTRYPPIKLTTGRHLYPSDVNTYDILKSRHKQSVLLLKISLHNLHYTPVYCRCLQPKISQRLTMRFHVLLGASYHTSLN